MILDEPLSSLDPLAKEEAMEMLRELGGEEISILISSHTVADLEKLADYLPFSTVETCSCLRRRTGFWNGTEPCREQKEL